MRLRHVLRFTITASIPLRDTHHKVWEELRNRLNCLAAVFGIFFFNIQLDKFNCMFKICSFFSILYPTRLLFE